MHCLSAELNKVSLKINVALGLYLQRSGETPGAVLQSHSQENFGQPCNAGEKMGALAYTCAPNLSQLHGSKCWFLNNQLDSFKLIHAIKSQWPWKSFANFLTSKGNTSQKRKNKVRICTLFVFFSHFDFQVFMWLLHFLLITKITGYPIWYFL